MLVVSDGSEEEDEGISSEKLENLGHGKAMV